MQINVTALWNGHALLFAGGRAMLCICALLCMLSFICFFFSELDLIAKRLMFLLHMDKKA